MYKEIEGNFIDLVKSKEYDIACHGANCFSIMGAGIAKQIKDNFPNVYLADKNSPNSDKTKFAGFTFANVDGTLVFNLYTQHEPGRNFDYDALKICLRKLKLLFKNQFNNPNKKSILFPKIGCGIGGGDWDKVKKIIIDELDNNFDITIVIYKPEK